MKYLALIFILFFSCAGNRKQIEVVNLANESVEMALKPDGTLVQAFTKTDIRCNWAETLIRGLHDRGQSKRFLFNDSLYNIFYTRKVERLDGVFVVPPNGKNFIKHQADKNIIRAYDIPKLDIRKNIAFAWSKILASSIADSVRNDEIENVLEWERFPFGKRGRKAFTTLRFDGLTKRQAKAYCSEVDKITVIDGKQDTTRRVPRFRMNPTFLRDSVRVLGKPLRTLTVRNIIDSKFTPFKIKRKFQRLVGKGKITGNTTLWELRGKASFSWLRHSNFKQKIKRRWLKRY